MNELQTPTPSKSDATLWIVALVGGMIVCLCAAGVFLFGVAGVLTFATAAPRTSPAPPPVLPLLASPTPTISVPFDPSPPPPGAEDTLAALEEADIPVRDRYDLAGRLLGITEAAVSPPGEYAVGDREIFYVDNESTNSVVEVEAEMVYRTDHVYMWVENGQDYDLDAIQRSADRFEQRTYPTNRSYFGSEPSPGIDGDVRLHILHSVELGSGIAGYFFSPSQYPAAIVPYSNEKEIFFINISNTVPGTTEYDSTLAHEFQHMIHWGVDRNEDIWMNEGLSEVAAYLNGFGPSGFMPYYLFNPDLQLTDWPEDGDTTPHYGASFLFNAYFLDRFGQDALRALVSHQENGLRSMDETLADLGEAARADDVFADWAIANILNDQDIDARYGYSDMPGMSPPGLAGTISRYPYGPSNAEVHQYGVDYIEIDRPGEVRITFEGAQQVPILPTSANNTDGDASTDDTHIWWSNRGDDSNMTLTRAIDLTDVTQATLEYSVWFWLESLWDYGYVEVSTDGGETWTLLETPYTTTENPHGNSYGPAYSGQSLAQPDATPEGWLRESLDLSAYAGQPILIRFEVITDDAVNQPGMAVDNVCVPEIDWCDDAESGESDWEARGFVRHNNVLPQRFIVQILALDAQGGATVTRLELDESNRGEASVTVPEGGRVVLVISGATRYTTEPAVYRLSVSAAD